MGSVFLRHELLTTLGVDHGFGTAGAFLPEGTFRGFRQVHGVEVPEVPAGTGLARAEADGGWTRDEGVVLGVFTADCLPVLLSSPEGGAVAAIHAGWRGAVRGIVPIGIRQIVEAMGIGPETMTVVLGPAIGRCCYPVGPEVWDEVRRHNPGFRAGDGDGRALDLAALVRHQALEEGVRPDRIGHVSLCTRCHPALFFSHRGMGESRHGRTMISYVRRGRLSG
jgi:YfiH family protein